MIGYSRAAAFILRVLKHNGGGSAYGFGARVVDSVAEFVVGVVYAGAVKYVLHAWQGNGCGYAKDGDDHKQLDDGKAAAGAGFARAYAALLRLLCWLWQKGRGCVLHARY